jgi:hypothetical protein
MQTQKKNHHEVTETNSVSAFVLSHFLSNTSKQSTLYSYIWSTFTSLPCEIHIISNGENQFGHLFICTDVCTSNARKSRTYCYFQAIPSLSKWPCFTVLTQYTVSICFPQYTRFQAHHNLLSATVLTRDPQAWPSTYYGTYLPNFKHQSPSWKATRSSASLEIPCTL